MREGRSPLATEGEDWMEFLDVCVATSWPITLSLLLALLSVSFLESRESGERQREGGLREVSMARTITGEVREISREAVITASSTSLSDSESVSSSMYLSTESLPALQDLESRC